VCAAGEAKTTLTLEGLRDAMAKASLFRKLKVKHTIGTMVYANASDRDRFYSSPAYFLVAIESEVALKTAGAEVARLGSFGSSGYSGGIDGVFLLDRGWAIDFGDGKGAFQLRSPTGRSVPGWFGRESSSVLFDFLAWLSSVILRTVRSGPILPDYLLQEEA
jgi:hypothetical protein